MTINEWLDRFSARCEQITGTEIIAIKQIAINTLAEIEQAQVTTELSPEEYADEEMAEWRDG